MAVKDVTDRRADRRKNEIRLWLSVLDLHSFVYRELNKKLKSEAGISVAKFDVLVQLKRFPDGLSMGDLSAKLKVSNGNVSGLVNRLSNDALVDKSMSRNDRRSFVAVLTPEGHQKMEKATVVLHDVLARCFHAVGEDTIINATENLRETFKKTTTGWPPQMDEKLDDT